MEMAGRAIENFKGIYDAWREKKLKTREFQAKVAEYLDSPNVTTSLKFDMIYRIIGGMPKAIHDTDFIMLGDVQYFINIYKDSEHSRYVTNKQREAARDNILFLFREAFFNLCSIQIAAEDERDDKMDDAALGVSRDVSKSYNKWLKRVARNQLADEEGDDERDEDGDGDDEPA